MNKLVFDIATKTSKSAIPRIMIAGTGSGCGKTTITCALLKAFIRRGLAVTSFKSGPDYIDPMFHSEMIGAKSRNLDMFLCGENTTKYLLAENGKNTDLSIIEGVMGFYDGLGMKDFRYSSYELSEKTRTPVILIINACGMSFSVLAMIKGFMEFKRNNIAGIILNAVSHEVYQQMKEQIEESLAVKVLGYMPKSREVIFESRHLGLVTAAEVPLLQDKLDALADMADRYMDLDAILDLAKTAPLLEYNEIYVKKEDPVKIAIARDKAFCFYYEDSLDLLRKMGVELIPFSPLVDDKLPDGISGLILGGGYPELYLEQLGENTSMTVDIRLAIEKGLPVYAECGGFMYLGKTIKKAENKNEINDDKYVADKSTAFRMVGAIDMNSEMTTKLQNFGYTVMMPKNDSFGWNETNQAINAHEFHYSTSDLDGGAYTSDRVSSGKHWDSSVIKENMFAGYPHLHFWGNPQVAKNFLNKCKNYKM